MTYTFLNYPPENIYKRLVFTGSKFLINDEWKEYDEGSLGSSLNAKTQVLSIEQYDIDTTLKECVSKDTSLTDVSYRSFYKCTSLSSISLPNATSIGSEAFLSCISLSSISLPNATLIDRWAFQNCSSLTSVSLPNATSIGEYAFIYCASLSSITLGNTTRVVTLNSTGAFSGLPTDYKVYVPANLYNDYINATNWSRIKEHIAVIS